MQFAWFIQNGNPKIIIRQRFLNRIFLPDNQFIVDNFFRKQLELNDVCSVQKT